MRGNADSKRRATKKRRDTHPNPPLGSSVILESDVAQRGHSFMISATPLPPLPYSRPCYAPPKYLRSLTKAELLHKQNAQIKELRRKHEAAQMAVLAVAGVTPDEDEEGSQEQDGGEDCEDGSDEGSAVAALRKVC